MLGDLEPAITPFLLIAIYRNPRKPTWGSELSSGKGCVRMTTRGNEERVRDMARYQQFPSLEILWSAQGGSEFSA